MLLLLLKEVVVAAGVVSAVQYTVCSLMRLDTEMMKMLGDKINIIHIVMRHENNIFFSRWKTYTEIDSYCGKPQVMLPQ